MATAAAQQYDTAVAEGGGQQYAEAGAEEETQEVS